jgi:hypothetical protein
LVLICVILVLPFYLTWSLVASFFSNRCLDSIVADRLDEEGRDGGDHQDRSSWEDRDVDVDFGSTFHQILFISFCFQSWFFSNLILYNLCGWCGFEKSAH